MSDNLKKAKALLSGHTCVLCLGEKIKAFTERGIAPALFLAECGEELRGSAVADNVVGKATALLYASIGVTELYAGILSRRALPILERYGIAFEYGELTEYIVNRTKDGSCPMEAAVKDVDTPEEALAAVKKKLAELKDSDADKRS